MISIKKMGNYIYKTFERPDCYCIVFKNIENNVFGRLMIGDCKKYFKDFKDFNQSKSKNIEDIKQIK
jgi:hypothetical protein